MDPGGGGYFLYEMLTRCPPSVLLSRAASRIPRLCALLPRRRLGVLTHIDAHTSLPSYVDIASKASTRREAVASTTLRLPASVVAVLFPSDAGVAAPTSGSSGSAPPLGRAAQAVLSTAILAGVSGAKRTSELIPLCHNIALERCDITHSFARAAGGGGGGELTFFCRCVTTGKTGVEMEALVGAHVAALGAYDMLKAHSKDMVLCDGRLLSKTGGKSSPAAGEGAPSEYPAAAELPNR